MKRVIFVVIVLLIILLPMLGIGENVVFAGSKECTANGVGWGCARGGGPREEMVCRKSPSKPGC
jgi:hypothetical protein